MGAPRITAAMCARGRVLAEPRLSPDGSRVGFLANAGDRGQVVTVPTAGGAEVVVTSDPPASPAAAYGGGSFDWAGNGRTIVYTGTDGRVHEVPAGGGRSRPVVEHGPASCPAASPDGARVAFLLDGRDVGVAALEERGPWPVRLTTAFGHAAGTPDFCLDPAWSPDGCSVAWHEWDVPAMPWDASRIVLRRADGRGEAVLVSGGDGVSVQQPRFSPDGSSLAFLCDADGWLNLWVAASDGTGARPLLKEEVEHGEPSWGPGQRSFAWSPDGGRIAFCRNQGGFGRLCVGDVGTGAIWELSQGVHGGLSWVGDSLACLRGGAGTPTEVVVIETATREQRAVARGPVGGFEEAGLVEPEPVSWPGDDGGEVHGRLYRPAAPPDGLRLPPLLVRVHGGPTGQRMADFDARTAYFVDRGWAVLVPDHRGSTGWGRAYTQALAGRWGELDVSDTAAGMRAAAERGWCDATRMVPMGGSAGGFTVLLLLALHPELCAAGVDLFGVADLLELDETTHRFEKHYLHSIVGPLPDAAPRYRERSPVHLANRIRAPLLVLQGLDDKVVPPSQSQAVADRVRAAGGTVELHCYEGEGHGWLRPETVEDELTRTESFLRRHVLRWR